MSYNVLAAAEPYPHLPVPAGLRSSGDGLVFAPGLRPRPPLSPSAPIPPPQPLCRALGTARVSPGPG